MAGGEGGFFVDVLGGGEGALKEGVENFAYAVAVTGVVVGVFDLREDLGFADDHGIERAGDGVEVLDHGAVFVVVEVGAKQIGREFVEAGDEGGEIVERGLGGEGAGEVELDAVAGGKDDELGIGEACAELGEGFGGLRGRKGDGLAQRERGRAVVEAGDQQAERRGGFWKHRFHRVQFHLAATKAPMKRMKPRIESHAARGPRKRGLRGTWSNTA
jgi:hypothetical protein